MKESFSFVKRREMVYPKVHYVILYHIISMHKQEERSKENKTKIHIFNIMKKEKKREEGSDELFRISNLKKLSIVFFFSMS